MASASVGGEGLGFGLAFSLDDRFSNPSQAIQQEFGRLTNASDKMSERISNSMDTIYRGMAQIGAGVAVLIPIRSVITAFSEFDSLQRGMLAVMKNNVMGVNAEMKRLEEVAKLPGLGLKEALQGSINLQAAGLSADLARRSLMGFGNALSMVGKGKAELSGVNLALSQIMSKGKVMAQEINQIAERVPQIRGLMKAAFGTADTEELQKMKMTSQQFIEGVVGQLEKLPKVTGGIQNSMENLQDGIWKMKVAIGKALAPAIEYLADKVQGLFVAVEKFAGTSFGRITMQATGLFLAFLSGSLILRGIKMLLPGVSGLIGGMGGIFTVVTKSARLLWGALTLASGGVTALTTAMKAFMMSNIITIALMAIVLVVTQLYRAWNAFSDVLSGNAQIMGGYMGFLQRLGGYLQAIGEIFSTVTSGGWNMSKAMEDMLQKMGILDNVIALGTWIVRIREFIVGMLEPIKSAFSFFGEIVGKVFRPMAAVISKIFASTGLSRMMWSMKVIHNIGWSIGAVFGIIIRVLTVVVAAIVGLGMTFFIIISGMVRGIMWFGGLLYDIVKGFITFIYAIGSAIWELIKWIGNGFMQLGSIIWGWITSGYEAGKTFVLNLWEGIKSVWNDLVNWIKNAWSNVTGIFGKELSVTNKVNNAPAAALSNVTQNANNAPAAAAAFSGVTQNTNFLDKNMGNRTVANNAPAAAAYSMQPQYIDRSTETVRNVQNVITLDGRVIHQSVNEASSMDAALGGF